MLKLKFKLKFKLFKSQISKCEEEKAEDKWLQMNKKYVEWNLGIFSRKLLNQTPCFHGVCCAEIFTKLRVSVSDLINLSKEINFAYTDVVKSRKRYLMNMTASIFEEFVICM